MACYTIPEVKSRELSRGPFSPPIIPELEKFVPLKTVAEDMDDDFLDELSKEVVDVFATSEVESPTNERRPSTWSAGSGYSVGSDMTRASSAEDLSEEIATELFELCLSVCMATGPLALQLLQAITEGERAVLRNIISLSKIIGLTKWKDSKLNLVVPLSEAVKVFLQDEDDECSVANKATTGSHSSEKPGFRRSGSGVSNDSGAKKRAKFRRSGSNCSQNSCGSFSDLLRVQTAKSNGETSRPMFLDVLLGLVAGEKEADFGDLADGIDLRQRFGQGRSSSNLSKHEVVSEAGLSYHSVDNALIAGPSKPTTFTALGGQFCLGIKTQCLKTQAAMQKRVLTQQKQILNSVTTKLILAERMNVVGQKVMKEQREALTSFRKVASRAKMQIETKLTVWIVEPDVGLRSDLAQLCAALGYRCHAFTSLAQAQESVACQQFEHKSPNDRSDRRMRTIFSTQSMSADMASISSVGSADSTASANELQSSDLLLEGKPGYEFDDWRSQSLMVQQETEDVHIPKDPDGGLQLVMVSPSCLQEFPVQWAHVRPAVMLTSQPEEIDDIFSCLDVAGSNLAFARVQLALQGISEWLIHPISMQAMAEAVKQVFRSHIYEEYLNCSRLGNGGGGMVSAVIRTSDGKGFAMKEISTKNRKKSREAAHEFQVLQELRWPSVLFAVDTWFDSTSKLRHLVMPLLPDGSLEAKLKSRLASSTPDSKKDEPSPITDDAVIQQMESWFIQTLHGLAYIHHRGLIHRDIKPANLALYGQEKGLMIVDFGSCLVMDGEGPFPVRRSIAGGITSPAYSPPEAYALQQCSASSDMWATGACFYEMVTGLTLIPAASASDALGDAVLALDFSKSQQRSIFETCSGKLPLLAKAVPATLHKDHTQRPWATQLICSRTHLHTLKRVLVSLGTFKDAEDASHHFECFMQIADIAAKSMAK
mmetsp:Transcript_89101/g.195174  ORF Transcript_89101/g.195174 Transcript_89101/m.195174 type:complete len:936 (+) Transcript_89101:457-3264(+)|eukprot:CAMPEP_0206547070 /NCGR_PEP_ID=MMETSP0325_2-20121206/13087_1 /ASSEMBLY_ACC=CAM_ASM_000347 /TAXON_ID=2866 /ORGANISM="Crypthecodinium cohnii, Strain Seligo" /LENGTH=935 /DNA_ID=CAMNT_0054046325 /DNA_START=350 /DNA_END=3157 /DNA_ORIENTATION=+